MSTKQWVYPSPLVWIVAMFLFNKNFIFQDQ